MQSYIQFLKDLYVCNKKQMYGAEYFLIPAPKIMKPIFNKN